MSLSGYKEGAGDILYRSRIVRDGDLFFFSKYDYPFSDVHLRYWSWCDIRQTRCIGIGQYPETAGSCNCNEVFAFAYVQY